MNRRILLSLLLLLFVAEACVLLLFVARDTEDAQDAILVNEALQSVQADYGTLENHKNQTGLDYVVLALDGTVLYQTKPGLSKSIHMAIVHRDTILDIKDGGCLVGKLLVANGSAQAAHRQRRATMLVLLAAMLMQLGLCLGYVLYIDHAMVKPFQKLKGVAERIAGGNLDIPFEMDRQNLFGAFTESFDIMRSELKEARRAQALANAAKKELVAKLSHDIKTPIASIKAASEVGQALTDNKRIKENYTQIIHKADQINALITNLFTATLEELQQLPITPDYMESKEVGKLLENSDYLHRAKLPTLPECMLYADKLRLQQVFDNLFANSYKYGNTAIDVAVCKMDSHLMVTIEDYGGGVSKEELPLLKEKFKRGANAKNTEGAGLGLFISDYFMKGMQGELVLENGANGLKATVILSLLCTVS